MLLFKTMQAISSEKNEMKELHQEEVDQKDEELAWLKNVIKGKDEEIGALKQTHQQEVKTLAEDLQ